MRSEIPHDPLMKSILHSPTISFHLFPSLNGFVVLKTRLDFSGFGELNADCDLGWRSWTE